jgi:hypothetical protein
MDYPTQSSKFFVNSFYLLGESGKIEDEPLVIGK